MRFIISVLLAGMVIFGVSKCVMPNKYSVIAPGVWRAVLKLEGKNVNPARSRHDLLKKDEQIIYEEVTEGELPFTFDVVYDSEEEFHIEIINGEERIIVDDITYGKNTRTGLDTMRINFPIYDTHIWAVYEHNVIEGEWVVRGKKDYKIPFIARQGKDYRFTSLRKEPVMDVSGKWKVKFEVETDHPYDAIAEFKQDGNYLTGTFLTETGDYRYLQGTIQADKIYLSVFDGSHAFLFEAKILEDRTLSGGFWSGNHYKTTWVGQQDPNATLKSAYELTYLKKGYDKISFSFPDTDNKMVSLTDSKFDNKVKVVQIFGTWCPNCRDETKFLSKYYNDLKSNDLAVVSLAYERSSDFDKASAAVKRYKEKFDIQYDMLIAGTDNKAVAGKTLPMLNHVLSFPTLIFIDKNDKVRKIHTGFNGPATSKYSGFVKEFDKIIKELLSE